MQKALCVKVNATCMQNVMRVLRAVLKHVPSWNMFQIGLVCPVLKKKYVLTETCIRLAPCKLCHIEGRQQYVFLRVRAFFHKTVRVCHVYCNFKSGCTCRNTVIFGTLKDGSLLINTLASNICFSYRNMFQNGVDALSKIVDAFLSKSSKFYLVRIIW